MIRRIGVNNWLGIALVVLAAVVAGVLALIVHAKDEASPWPGGPPVAAVQPAVDTYFGVQVTDPYQWLENAKDPAVVPWMKGQNDYTRALLERIPGRKALVQRVQALDNAGEQVTGVQWAAGHYFYFKTRPGENSRKLYVRTGVAGKERLLVDPDRLAVGAQHAAIDYFRASWDGKYVAYGISPGGSENSVLRIVETATGRELPERIDRAQFGSPSWRADGRSLFYNRLRKLGAGTQPTDRYRRSQVYLHVLRTDPEQDVAVFGDDLSSAVHLAPDDIPFVQVTLASPYAFGIVAHGVKNEITLYAAPLKAISGGHTPWRKLVDEADDVTGFEARGDELYLQTHRGASRFKLVRTSMTHPDPEKAQTVVPESEAVITNLKLAKDGLYIQELDGGPSQLLRLPLGRKGSTEVAKVALPFAGSISEIVADPRLPGALVRLQSWTQSPVYYAFDPSTNALMDTRLMPASPVDFSQIESVEVKATSADGTRVPLSIVYQRGIKRDGSNPTLLTGYGAYGITLDPTFSPTRLAWLEKGGIVAVAHVRGGGEYGEDWHKGGQKLTKQNTMSDFIACAEYLILEKYTSSAKLAGLGGSAGGITIGGAITQRPDLFAAAVSEVGVADNLRIELTPNGPPNIPEFGSVKTEEGFKALYAMSSYHHVKDGTAYPAVLLTTGINDPRVDSWQAAKMTARLQAATSSGKPILLRVDYDAGHGIGSTKGQNDQELADIDAFLLWQFGAPEFQPKPTEENP